MECIYTAFKTDVDISKTAARRERELQAWKPDASDSNASAPSTGAAGTRNVDELTFGPGASGGSWDQFAANEQLFGVKANFDEDVYTTKLDRNAPDFKEKERKAAQIASEIMNVSAIQLTSATIADEATSSDDVVFGASCQSCIAYVLVYGD